MVPREQHWSHCEFCALEGRPASRLSPSGHDETGTATVRRLILQTKCEYMKHCEPSRLLVLHTVVVTRIARGIFLLVLASPEVSTALVTSKLTKRASCWVA